jgi:hypothetical protein
MSSKIKDITPACEPSSTMAAALGVASERKQKASNTLDKWNKSPRVRLGDSMMPW